MSTSEENLKKTPYSDFHIAAGAKMVPFAGYLMPVQYSGIIAEHKAVRNSVGLFDLSHMGEFEVSGKGAKSFLQSVTTNDVSALEVGQVQYTCMTYEDGGIIDDLLIYRLESDYLLVVNAANIEKDFDWLSQHLTETGDVKLVNRSEELSLLAIQGPQAQALLEELTDLDLDGLEYYRCVCDEVAGRDVLFSRTGYTGEDGFEFYIPVEDGEFFWKAFVKAGKKYDLALIGLGARDSLRLEMKMALYGNDIDQTTNPYEAGLGWVVKLDAGRFVGSEILEKIKKEKPARRLVSLVLDGKAFPRAGYKIFDGSEEIGVVTSGTMSPSLGVPIALGYVPRRLSKPGNHVEIEIRGKRFGAAVVKPPFYKKPSVDTA